MDPLTQLVPVPLCLSSLFGSGIPPSLRWKLFKMVSRANWQIFDLLAPPSWRTRFPLPTVEQVLTSQSKYLNPDNLEYCGPTGSDSFLTNRKQGWRLLEETCLIGIKAHENQRRNNGDPYVREHILGVQILAFAVAKDLEERFNEHSKPSPIDPYVLTAAAILHDTSEDSPLSIRQLVQRLKDEFATRGNAVIDIVGRLTKRPKSHYSHLQSKEEAKHERELNPLIRIYRAPRIEPKILKLIDKLCNIATDATNPLPCQSEYLKSPEHCAQEVVQRLQDRGIDGGEIATVRQSLERILQHPQTSRSIYTTPEKLANAILGEVEPEGSSLATENRVSSKCSSELVRVLKELHVIDGRFMDEPDWAENAVQQISRRCSYAAKTAPYFRLIARDIRKWLNREVRPIIGDEPTVLDEILDCYTGIVDGLVFSSGGDPGQLRGSEEFQRRAAELTAPREDPGRYHYLRVIRDIFGGSERLLHDLSTLSPDLVRSIGKALSASLEPLLFRELEISDRFSPDGGKLDRAAAALETLRAGVVADDEPPLWSQLPTFFFEFLKNGSNESMPNLSGWVQEWGAVFTDLLEAHRRWNGISTNGSIPQNLEGTDGSEQQSELTRMYSAVVYKVEALELAAGIEREKWTTFGGIEWSNLVFQQLCAAVGSLSVLASKLDEDCSVIGARGIRVGPEVLEKWKKQIGEENRYSSSLVELPADAPEGQAQPSPGEKVRDWTLAEARAVTEAYLRLAKSIQLQGFLDAEPNAAKIFPDECDLVGFYEACVRLLHAPRQEGANPIEISLSRESINRIQEQFATKLTASEKTIWQVLAELTPETGSPQWRFNSWPWNGEVVGTELPNQSGYDPKLLAIELTSALTEIRCPLGESDASNFGEVPELVLRVGAAVPPLAKMVKLIIAGDLDPSVLDANRLGAQRYCQVTLVSPSDKGKMRLEELKKVFSVLRSQGMSWNSYGFGKVLDLMIGGERSQRLKLVLSWFKESGQFGDVIQMRMIRPRDKTADIEENRSQAKRVREETQTWYNGLSQEERDLYVLVKAVLTGSELPEISNSLFTAGRQ